MDLCVADAGNAVRPGARLVHPRAPRLSVVVHYLASVLATITYRVFFFNWDPRKSSKCQIT